MCLRIWDLVVFVNLGNNVLSGKPSNKKNVKFLGIIPKTGEGLHPMANLLTGFYKII